MRKTKKRTTFHCNVKLILVIKQKHKNVPNLKFIWVCLYFYFAKCNFMAGSNYQSIMK